MSTAANPVTNYPATELPALQMASKRRASRRFGRIVLFLLLLVPIPLALAPWQQNLPGEGRVIEFDPANRPIPIQARTNGIAAKWHVREGQKVKAGDPIVDLMDNDPDILDRLQEELDATQRKRQAAIQKRQQFTQQVTSAQEARAAAMQLADDEIAAALQSVTVAKQAKTVADEKLKLTATALKMWEGLVADRIGAGFDLQKAKQEHSVAIAQQRAREAAVAGAEANLRAKRSARLRVERSEEVKVQNARAKRDAADGEVATADASLPKLRRNLARQRQQQVTAPTDGFVQRLNANGQAGGFVKQGQTLATLVPEASQVAVELYIDGNDISFVDIGRHVRLQFEGWPAVQWVGWPSAAVGTFGGKVAFIDRFDNGSGKFRIMVVPDDRPLYQPEGTIADWLRGILTFTTRQEERRSPPWPDDIYLRQGMRAKGWVVLDSVSLGFEIWRQLNGFPPSLDRPRSDDNGGGK